MNPEIHAAARAAAQQAHDAVYDDYDVEQQRLLTDALQTLNSVTGDRDEALLALQAVTTERDSWRTEAERIQAAYEEHLRTHTVTPPPTTKTWYIGMATEKDLWDERLAQVNRPVNVRRRFEPDWQPSAMLAMAKECHASGCLPSISMKLGPSGEGSVTSWSRAASGAYDAQFEQIGRDLAALGYPVRVTYHHEPRSSTVKTKEQLLVWAQALTRGFVRMRMGAGAEGSKRLILGPFDNGFPWGAWTGGVTKADLDYYYPDSFVAACDVMGADFYDGVTDTNAGEAAWLKMDGFRKYWDARGFQGVNNPGWKYDAGETQVYKPEHFDQMWSFLNTPAGKDFNNIAVFNSGNNNRDDIPSDIGGTWVLSGARLEAFRRMLDGAKVQRV